MKKHAFLGPCIGETTHHSAKLWIHTPLLYGDKAVEVAFSIHEGSPDASPLAIKKVSLLPANLGCGTVVFDELKPDTVYFYRVYDSDGQPIAFPGLKAHNLFFRTFPAQPDEHVMDFLLLTCHDPIQSRDDGKDGFRVWAAMSQIRKANHIRFAILAGDQIYGDYIQEKALAEKSERKRLKLYLDVYQKAWNNPYYRKTLCSLPTYLMWDDHDITDGWGSRSDLFVDATSSEVTREWKGLYGAARRCFEQLQASRNPAPLRAGADAGFDFCFKIGRAGFAVTDLRSHRNSRKHQVWSQKQFEAVRDWILEKRSELDVLFFVSPVVFTHGWPNLEKIIRRFSPFATLITQLLSHTPGLKQIRPVQRLIKRNIEDVAGFRDDLQDAWASDPNRAQAEQLLDFLFALQNPAETSGQAPLPVVILSGDIHAAGYSMLYSYKPEHAARPVIEHICSSPVSSQPVHWLIEALYQNHVKSVPVGTSGSYSAQVNHHHCVRNVVVLSLRRFGEELQLKAKYYLEDRPQPEIVVSDLRRVSRAEAIDWEAKPRAERGEVIDRFRAPTSKKVA